MIARLLRSEDFERVLRARSCGKSTHFALHHLAEPPSRPRRALPGAAQAKLSTDPNPAGPAPVDDLVAPAPGGLWLGAVVPKRHARRAVTRSLLKRQIRAVVASRRDLLASGLWVVRLRASFDRSHFVSAASEALKRVARTELEGLMNRAAPSRAAR